MSNSSDALQVLLSRRGDPNALADTYLCKRVSPLWLAARNNHSCSLCLLLEARGDPNLCAVSRYVTCYRMTPMHANEISRAYWGTGTEVREVLQQSGASHKCCL